MTSVPGVSTPYGHNNNFNGLMKRHLNIILLALALMSGCTASDRVQEDVTFTLSACGPDGGLTKAAGTGVDDSIYDLIYLIYDENGKCVWSMEKEGDTSLDPEEESVRVTLPGAAGKTYTAVVIANTFYLDGSDYTGEFVWGGLEQYDYDRLKGITFDGYDIFLLLMWDQVMPMYGELAFTVTSSGTVSVPLSRIMDKLTMGAFESSGELAQAGVSFAQPGGTAITLSFEDVPQIHLDGTPSEDRHGSDYSVTTNLVQYLTLTQSVYFAAGSLVEFSFAVGGETLSYDLVPTPPSGGQRGNIHYVMTRGVFSSSVLCWPEFIISVENWGATVQISENI